MNDDEAQAFFLRQKRLVEKFVLSKGLLSDSPEFHSLINEHIKLLLGLHENTNDTTSVMIKSFKVWLQEKNYA
jgi:hypothetical protein